MVTQQRTTEWLHVSDREYHERQFATPYRSTVHMVDWLDASGVLASARRIVDIGSGAGANVAYLGRRFEQTSILGVDLNPELAEVGNAYFAAHGLSRCSMTPGDLYELPDTYKRTFDGVISFQTLSWLPEEEPALRAFARLEPQWIAISSLFYDGPVGCRIEVSDYSAPIAGEPCKRSFYNIYSIPRVRDLLASLGYQRFDFVPFELDVELPRPSTEGMGTFTEKLAGGRTLQISGPLLMPWYFILARR